MDHIIGMVKLIQKNGIYEYSEQNDNNYSMSFNGNDDYIDIPDIPMYGEQYTGEFSFSAYVYVGERTATDYFNILSAVMSGNLYLQWGCEDDNLISLFIPAINFSNTGINRYEWTCFCTYDREHFIFLHKRRISRYRPLMVLALHLQLLDNIY